MRSLSGGNMTPLSMPPHPDLPKGKYPPYLNENITSRVGNHGRIITDYGSARVFQGKITRVNGQGFGYLPYVGENPQAVQEQIALFNQMRVAGASNREIGIAMRNLAAKWRGKLDVHIQGTPPPSVIEE